MVDIPHVFLAATMFVHLPVGSLNCDVHGVFWALSQAHVPMVATLRVSRICFTANFKLSARSPASDFSEESNEFALPTPIPSVVMIKAYSPLYLLSPRTISVSIVKNVRWEVAAGFQ